jgi:Galactose oxidase, central domain
MQMSPIFWTQEQDIGPQARAGHACAYDSSTQRVVVFGGDPGGMPLADTWAWDGNLWTQIADTGPSPRHGAALVDEPSRGRLLLFGGGLGSDVLDDTWVFGGGAWTQVADTGPLARVNHAMAYDQQRQRVVLFGGQAAGLFGDTWEWDGDQWTQVEDAGPAGRAGHAMAYDQAASRTVLFGGWNIGNSFNDTWAWNGTAWTQLADTGPEPRAEAAMVGADGVLLFGGVNTVDPGVATADRVMYGDTWQLTGDAWTKVQDIGPAARYGHSLALRGDVSRATLFGGAAAFAQPQDPTLAGGLTRDTWEVPVASSPLQPVPGQVTVMAVGVQPDTVPIGGGMLSVNVMLTQPAPYNMGLNAVILQDLGGNFQPASPQGFDIPQLVVQAGMATFDFQIVRNADPLLPGQYAIGVGAGPMVEAIASFTVM